MVARNRVRMGLSYWPDRLHRLAESIPVLFIREIRNVVWRPVQNYKEIKVHSAGSLDPDPFLWAYMYCTVPCAFQHVTFGTGTASIEHISTELSISVF
jgi:hypothetical protein